MHVLTRRHNELVQSKPEFIEPFQQCMYLEPWAGLWVFVTNSGVDLSIAYFQPLSRGSLKSTRFILYNFPLVCLQWKSVTLSVQ